MSISNKSLSEVLDEGKYSEVRYRWVVFTVYIMGALVNSLPTQTFSSINSLVEEKFKYSATVVTLNTLIFPVTHPIFAFPANWILDKFGMAQGCFGGGILLIIGVWLRTLIEVEQPTFCLLGSILAAIGNIFILNSPSLLATNWFKPSSIPGIISLSVLANLISVGLGASLPGLILEKQSSPEQIRSFLRIEALIISIPIILMMILLRNRPSVPPSKSAVTENKEKENYIQVIKKLFKNSEYLKIMGAMIFSYGTLTSYLAILDQAISSIDGKTDSGQITGQIIASAMLIGIIASFIFVRKIKTTFQYKLVILIDLLGSFLTFSIVQLALCFKYTQDIAIIFLGGSVGFFVIPVASLLIAYSSECVYPLGEASAAGYLFAGSQTFGFVLGIVSVSLVDDEQNLWKTYIIFGFHSFFYLIAFVCIFLTKQQLNRTKYEILSQRLLPQDQVKS